MQLFRGDAAISWSGLFYLWQSDSDFTRFFVQHLADTPYESFCWECPVLLGESVQQPLEYVLINAPDLHGRSPDTSSFAKPMSRSQHWNTVAVFPNLGADATLVVPRECAPTPVYTDIASFSRSAPEDQQQEFWAAVAQTMEVRCGDLPVWLNTAGGGVAWLHVRLDDAPKYYRFAGYC